jgi:hypothetical protein
MILVLTVIRIQSIDDILAEFHRLSGDAKSLSVYHKTCDWVVCAVLTSQNLLELFNTTMSSLPLNIKFRVEVHVERFNKWTFLKSLSSRMIDYDYVLFKDNDQRIAGFPWNTFIKRNGNAVISGPLRTKETLIRDRRNPNQQGFKFHDALEWQRPSRGSAWGALTIIEAYLQF